MDNIIFKEYYKYIKENYNKIINKDKIYNNTELSNKESFKHRWIAALLILSFFLPMFLIFFIVFFSFNFYSGLATIILGFFSFLIGLIISRSIFANLPENILEISNSKKEKLKKDLKSIKNYPFIDFIESKIDFSDYSNLYKYLNLDKEKVTFNDLFIFYLKKLSPESFFNNEKYIFDLFKKDENIIISKSLLQVLSNNYIELYKEGYLQKDDINKRIQYFENFKSKKINNLDSFKEKIFNNIMEVELENDIFNNLVVLKKEKNISF